MDDKTYLMKCGHIANSITGDGRPCCVICSHKKEAFEVEKEVDDGDELLVGRMAKCPDCGKTVSSCFGLPFFEYRPDREYDSYYCGCRGWD